MKHAKRMTAVLLALLLLAALAVPGMAASASVTYTPVRFELTSLGLSETLTAKYADYKNPAVTYTLTLGEMKVFNSYDYCFYSDIYGIETGKQYAPSKDTETAAKNALNKKTLATATFAANEVPYEESSGTKMSKTVSYSPADGILAAINDLRFDRPCIVYWPVTKDITCESSDLTNFNHNRATDGTTQTVMILRVDDNGSGVLIPTLSFAAPQVINPTTLMALLEQKYAASGDETPFEEWVKVEYGYDDLDAFFSEYTTNYAQFMDDFGPGSDEKPSPDINYANFPYIFTESYQKFQEFQDEYPATNSLKVEKLVTGNQGKKDQYFKFTVVLGGYSDNNLDGVLPSIASQLKYVTANSVHTATPKYGERFVTYNDANPPVITSRYDNEHPTVRIKNSAHYNDTPGDLFYDEDPDEGGYPPDWISLDDWIEIDFWLKHGESFEIKNIPANVGFFAAFERPSVEGDMLNNIGADPNYHFDGYTVTTLYSRTETEGQIPQLDYTYEHDYHGSITEGAVDLTWSGQQSFSPYTSDDKVTFTNSKETSTPTGLSLQTAAPIAGAVIALSLGAVLLLSRRRRGSAQ